MTTTTNNQHIVDDDLRTVQRPLPHLEGRPARVYRTQVSVAVLAAFSLSAAYTIYLTAAGTADPHFDATAPAAWLFYALGFGLAGLSRNTRRFAVCTLATALTALIAVTVFVYPSTFTAAQQTTFGWFENDIYTGLLVLALYLTAQNLRGVTLSPTDLHG